MPNKIKANAQTDIAEAAFDPFVPLTSQSLFWRSHYLKPSEALGALPLLFWLTECVRPSLTVTLGMTDAVPHFATCQAIDKLGVDAMCFGVDLPAREADETAAHGLSEDIRRYNNQHYSEFSELLSGSHDDCAQLLDGSMIDMLVVSQFASQSLQDAIDSHWLPRLSGRAIVLFLAGGEKLGAYVERLTHDSGSFALDPKNRTCVALHGDQHSNRIQRLGQLRIGKPGYLSARNIFMRVGELHSNAIRLEELVSNGGGAIAPGADVARLETSLAEQTEHAERLATELNEKAAQIAGLQSEAFEARQAAERIRVEFQDKLLSLTEEYTRVKTKLDVVETEARISGSAAQQRVEELTATLAAQKMSARERTQAYKEELEATASFEKAAKTAQARAETLTAQLQTAEDRLTETTKALETGLGDLNALGLELETRTKELEKTKAQLTKATEQDQAHNDQLQTAQSEIARLQAALDDQKATDTAQVTALTAQLQTAKDQLKEAAVRASEQDEAHNARVLAAENVLEQRLGDIEVLGLELAEKESALADSRAKNTDLTSMLTRSTEESNEALSIMRAQMDSGQRELQDRLRLVERERDEARSRAAQLEESTSWRVTAPLRRASLMVRRDRGHAGSGDDKA